MKKENYKGYLIKKGLFGYFARPVDETEHLNEDRFGNSPSFNTREEAYWWVDDKKN